MGKQSRDKAEKRAAREAQENTSLPEKQIITRRRVLGGLAILAAGGAAYSVLPGRHEPSDAEGGNAAPQTPQPLTQQDTMNESPSPYISLREGVAIYNRLAEIISEKSAEAQGQNKPLHVFALSQHNSIDALACELMVIDIAKRHRIDNLILEKSKKELAELANADVPPLEEQQPYMERTHAIGQILIRDSFAKDLALRAMDNRYADSYVADQSLDEMTQELAREKIGKQYNVTDLSVSIETKNHDTGQYETNVKGIFNPPLDDNGNKHVLLLVDEARIEADNRRFRERNPVMLETIREYPSAVVITGATHGKALISPLKKDGEIVLAFNFADTSSAGKNDSSLKAEIQWAKDPANAVQMLPDKHFNSANLPLFIDRVIEKANSQSAHRSTP